MADQVVVIGGGVGGLSAAIRLAVAGKSVTVVEQNATVGGKMAQVFAEGYRWDTGPSVITMRHVLEELFEVAGRRLEDYLTLAPLEPLTRYFYTDGTVLDASSDIARMAEQIGKLDERDVEGYLAYLAYAARLHRITGPAFVYEEPPSLRSFTRVSPLDILKVDAWRSMDGAIKNFVHSPQLRQLLGRFATYVGASPYRAPATLNVIAHVEMTGGVWYPQGGIYRIAEALLRLAQELGVEVRTACTVRQIAVRDGQVQGVTLADETFLPAQAVIANVDVATVYEKLLPSNIVKPAKLQRLMNAEPSCSGFIMLLGVKGQNPRLAHHNIFFSDDYPAEFEAIFKRGVPPPEPTIYVSITAKSDPQDAPDGCENWFVLVNAPAVDGRFDWQAQSEPSGASILDQLAGYGLDVRDKIRVQQIFTPLDLERMTGARGGALYGASSNNMLAAFKRPNNRATDVRGLYFAGGTTHPGGGVPMVMLSGKVAAGMVLEDC